jgi:hypothetical protein
MAVTGNQPKDLRVGAAEQPIYPIFDLPAKERHMEMLGNTSLSVKDFNIPC